MLCTGAFGCNSAEQFQISSFIPEPELLLRTKKHSS